MAKILKSLKLEADLIAYAESINPVFGQAIETIIIDHKNGNITAKTEAIFDNMANDFKNVVFTDNTEIEKTESHNNTVFIDLNKIDNIEVKKLLMLNGFEAERYLTTEKEAEIQAQLQSIINQQTTQNITEATTEKNTDNTKVEHLELVILSLKEQLLNEQIENEKLIELHQKEIEQLKQQTANTITPNITTALNQLQEFRKCNIAVIQDFAHYSQNLTRKLRTKGTFESIIADHYPAHLHYLLQE